MTQYELYENEVFKNLRKLDSEQKLQKIQKQLETIESAYNEENLYKFASTILKLHAGIIELVMQGGIDMEIAMHPEKYLTEIS